MSAPLITRPMLVTYTDVVQHVGLVVHDRVINLEEFLGTAILTMNDVIDEWQAWGSLVGEVAARMEHGAGRALAEYRLAPPIPRPRRNPFLIAGNYQSHVLAGERASGIPYSQRKQAIFFTKPSGSIIGNLDDIQFDPDLTQKLDYELELVVIIGRTGRDIPVDRAMDYVFGYSVGNDISARDIQAAKPTTDFLRGKGLDTFFPMGPGIVPRDFLPDYRDCQMTLSVNGQVKQSATPAEMTRDVPEIIADLSRGLTLEAGDIIATGTPSGVQNESLDPVWLQDGDEVISEIEGLGKLVNHVRMTR